VLVTEGGVIPNELLEVDTIEECPVEVPLGNISAVCKDNPCRRTGASEYTCSFDVSVSNNGPSGDLFNITLDFDTLGKRIQENVSAIKVRQQERVDRNSKLVELIRPDNFADLLTKNLPKMVRSSKSQEHSLSTLLLREQILYTFKASFVRLFHSPAALPSGLSSPSWR